MAIELGDPTLDNKHSITWASGTRDYIKEQCCALLWELKDRGGMLAKNNVSNYLAKVMEAKNIKFKAGTQVGDRLREMEEAGLITRVTEGRSTRMVEIKVEIDWDAVDDPRGRHARGSKGAQAGKMTPPAPSRSEVTTQFESKIVTVIQEHPLVIHMDGQLYRCTAVT